MAPGTTPPDPAPAQSPSSDALRDAVVRLLDRLGEPGRPSERTAVPTWQRILDSTGGAALITVLLGGLCGTVLTWVFQQATKERELQGEMVRAFHAARLEFNKTYLAEQTRLTEEALELAAKVFSAYENYAALAGPGFARRKDTGQESRLEAQREGIRREFNEAQAEWARRKYAVGFLLAHYYGGSTNVVERWDQVVRYVDNYSRCVLPQAGWAGSDPCKAEGEAVLQAIDELARQLAAEASPAVQRDAGLEDMRLLHQSLKRL